MGLTEFLAIGGGLRCEGKNPGTRSNGFSQIDSMQLKGLNVKTWIGFWVIVIRCNFDQGITIFIGLPSYIFIIGFTATILFFLIEFMFL